MRLIANGTQSSSIMPTPAAASGTPGYANNATPGIGVTPTALYPDDINILLAELMAILAAGGVSPDNTGATTNQVLTALKTVFGLRTVAVFTSSVTWTVPAGVTKLKVTVVGGGGGGAGSAAANGGGGGGAGGTAIGVYTVTPGASYTLTIGAGGAGGAPAANGSGGGTTSFGALATATGGQGGTYQYAGGLGGTGSGGSINVVGGGGSDGGFGPGTFYPGNGGGSIFGGGAKAATSGTPTAMTPGSGGGGFYLVSGSGGAGAAGFVIVEY